MSLVAWLILSSIASGHAKMLESKAQQLNTVEMSKMTLATDTEGKSSSPAAATDEVDQKEKPIFGGWIYVGDLSVGCKGTLSSTTPTDVSVLFDTGSSVLVLKTQKTFDFVAKEECESIEEMFVDVTGCNAGTCGKCYQHTACYTDHKKNYQITYGSGPVEVSMGAERIEIAGHVVDDVPLGEVTNFNVRTFMRKDFQGIAGLMHNANGAKDGGRSLFQSLRSKGMESFGYCINKEGESKLYWFDDRHLPDGAKKVPVVCQHHWGVTTNALSVGRTEIKPELSPDGYGTVASGGTPAPHLCGTAPCVAILDTGTNFIVAPNSIIENAVKEIVDAGFKEDCNFDYDNLPDLVFTLEKDQFHVKPHHYIVEQQVKSHGRKVRVCALLLGPMEGALQKKAEEKINAAQPGQASMSNVIILGTPFMRSNYIRFTHPQDKDPYIMIHEKCPEDFSEEKKLEIQKNQTATAIQKAARTHEGARFVEVSPHGEVINHAASEVPTVIRNTDDGIGKKLVKKNMQVLQQLGGEWVTKDWLAAMDEGRECTPGKVMNFTHMAEMGGAHALSPMFLLLATTIVAMLNL